MFLLTGSLPSWPCAAFSHHHGAGCVPKISHSAILVGVQFIPYQVPRSFHPGPIPSQFCPFLLWVFCYSRLLCPKCQEGLAERRQTWLESPSLSSPRDGSVHTKLSQMASQALPSWPALCCQCSRTFICSFLLPKHRPCSLMEVATMTNVSCIVI